MADTNPANFANLPKEKVQEIASKGGKASHGATGDSHADELAKAGRNPDGTFIAGGAAAKEAGHHSHDNDGKEESEDNGRRADGTFTKGELFIQCLNLSHANVITLRIGSEAAKEAGHIGGLHAHGKEDADDKKEDGRREDGTFVPGSEAAKEGMSHHVSLLQTNYLADFIQRATKVVSQPLPTTQLECGHEQDHEAKVYVHCG